MKTYKLLRITFTLILLLMVGISYAQLSGNYTIGGSSPDFAAISDAVNELQTKGVSGPVTFNLRSNTYEENGGAERVLYIDQQISGTSETILLLFNRMHQPVQLFVNLPAYGGTAEVRYYNNIRLLYYV